MDQQREPEWQAWERRKALVDPGQHGAAAYLGWWALWLGVKLDDQRLLNVASSVLRDYCVTAEDLTTNEPKIGVELLEPKLKRFARIVLRARARFAPTAR